MEIRLPFRRQALADSAFNIDPMHESHIANSTRGTKIVRQQPCQLRSALRTDQAHIAEMRLQCLYQTIAALQAILAESPQLLVIDSPAEQVRHNHLFQP